MARYSIVCRRIAIDIFLFRLYLTMDHWDLNRLWIPTASPVSIQLAWWKITKDENSILWCYAFICIWNIIIDQKHWPHSFISFWGVFIGRKQKKKLTHAILFYCANEPSYNVMQITRVFHAHTNNTMHNSLLLTTKIFRGQFSNKFIGHIRIWFFVRFFFCLFSFICSIHLVASTKPIWPIELDGGQNEKVLPEDNCK